MPNIHDLKVTDIDGKEVPLSTLKGKVALFVNVASACGFTPQYAELEQLHQQYKAKGLEILGFPSNDFGAQEPGSEAAIKEFCSTKYRITFPMFAKIPVKGDAKAPLYAALSEKAGEPKWNFHKYLVAKDGTVLKAFKSGVAPLSPELLGEIDKALAA